MNFILSDFNKHQKFLPLAFTRALADYRIGILTLKEKWELLPKSKGFCSYTRVFAS